ncbi:replication initiator [Nonomuraea fuscirosea]|uniref:replication initiator n=1 Tax=Nonomuraea fuscirosea TaxID=1291556 RepID=UPI00379BBD94
MRWPSADQVVVEGDHLPVWENDVGYLNPATGEVLPTWDEALGQLDADPAARPLHVVRFGDQVDVQSVPAGTPDADQCIRYLSKYLTESLGEGLGWDGQETRIVSHTVRWTVGAREKSLTFKTKGLAESFLSDLRQAAKNWPRSGQVP